MSILLVRNEVYNFYTYNFDIFINNLYKCNFGSFFYLAFFALFSPKTNLFFVVCNIECIWVPMN